MSLVALGAMGGDALAIPTVLFNPNGAADEPAATATIMAEASKFVYTDDPFERQQQFASIGARELLFLDERVETAVIENDKALIIVSRGTSEVSDYLRNARFTMRRPRWDRSVRVHNGFEVSADAVYSRVRDRARAARRDGTPVWVVGHSLGGAVGNILAYRLDRDGIAVAGVMTFGAPPAGNDDWGRRYDQRLRRVTHRFVHEKDRIPCIFLADRRWHHVGRMHRLTGDDRIDWEDSGSTCGGSESLDYHGIAGYRKRILVHVPPWARTHLTNALARIRRASDDSLTGAARMPTFDVVTSYRQGARDYIFMMRSSDGVGRVVDATDGRIGARVQTFDWSSGWIEAEAVNVRGVNYLYLVKSNGQLHVNRINSDGTTGRRIQAFSSADQLPDAPRCTNTFLCLGRGLNPVQHATPYETADGDHLLITGRFGTARAYAIAENGTLTRGAEEANAGVFTGQTAYRSGGRPYLFQINALTGAAQVRRLGRGGLGSVVRDYQWSRGWTAAEAYTDGGAVKVLLYKSGTGETHVNAVNTDGSMGRRLEDTTRVRGFGRVEPYGTAADRHLFMLGL